MSSCRSLRKGRIIGLMEAGWSSRRVLCQLSHSDCVPTASSVAIQAQVAPSLRAPVSSRTMQRCLAERCDEAGLFPLITTDLLPLADRRWENSRHFPNFWERILELGGQRFGPFFPDCPRRQKETH
ncbi:hypothetical protein TNCV_1408611 [Trichonephila clavipes]|uniref:Uncharacterized protein n=1 Tax=Trichonephila clavipes TaxID=2585209 RepID=A0A8X6R6D5_TRICX|nr:hypothetical protein TNCV_1408611 [Trichonephila clavipes]